MRAAPGQAISEAPRGINYNRYSFDENGSILSVRIGPPTSRNQKRIEDQLREYVPAIVTQTMEEITRRCEQAASNYDPCISCAPHFLRVKMERE